MATAEEFEAYKAKFTKLIKAQLTKTGCRPVLFLGSGITRRYLNGPGWIELLRQVAEKIGVSSDDFQLIHKRHDGDAIEIGTALSEKCMEWAFSGGANAFPKEYFGDSYGKDIFIKHIVAEIIGGMQNSVADESLTDEVNSFKNISPHAVITTNFDKFLESSFNEYEVIVGEKIIPFSLSIVAEIYKIHGCVSDINTMILTREDYDKFSLRRKYISAKMMTYFAEYPVFIFGYSMNDTNIKSILGDLAEATGGDSGILENVFLVKRERDLSSVEVLQEEFAVSSAGSSSSIRVRTIVTDDFKWIYDVLGDVDNPIRLSAGAMRTFAKKILNVVSSDIPSRRIDVNFARMEDLSTDPDQVLTLLGLTGAVDFERDYPYLTIELAGRLGVGSWQQSSFRAIRDAVNAKLEFNVRDSQNPYHAPMRTNRKGATTPRYSQRYLDLMLEVKAELGL
jgi:hypothetical protein